MQCLSESQKWSVQLELIHAKRAFFRDYLKCQFFSHVATGKLPSHDFRNANANVYTNLQNLDPKLINLKLLPVALLRALNEWVWVLQAQVEVGNNTGPLWPRSEYLHSKGQ